MYSTLATLTLASLLFAPLPQEVDTAGTAQAERQADTPVNRDELMESKLGFAIYKPQFINVNTLLNYVSALTDDRVEYFYTDATTGLIMNGSRRRFINMNNVIGVQDFEQGRKAALAILHDIDSRLGSVEEPEPTPATRSTPQLRTIQLRTLSMRTALSLIAAVTRGSVSVSPIEETGTIVLQGSLDAVNKAEALLRKVDQPLPQVTLHCSLIQAVDADDTDATGLMNDEVSQALARMLPGKRFRKVGQLLLRGSAGGNAEFKISSSLPGFGSVDSNTPARVSFNATARGFDAKTKILTLDECAVKLEIPTFKAGNDGSARKIPTGFYRSQKMSADLALHSGQTTVVGSLGGNQVYVSLRFEVAK